jgi:hypothetical protein
MGLNVQEGFSRGHFLDLECLHPGSHMVAVLTEHIPQSCSLDNLHALTGEVSEFQAFGLVSYQFLVQFLHLGSLSLGPNLL